MAKVFGDWILEKAELAFFEMASLMAVETVLIYFQE
jgi:hypothetical protein